MDTRHKEARVCIAGGGPAGIMLGYLLARAGISVIVLEKWPDFFRDFRGDTIHPSTMDALAELGLLDEFLALPHSEMARMSLTVGPDEVAVADFSHLPTRARFIAFIPQWDFLNFLATKAAAFPAFTLLMATDATGLIRDESGRITGITARDADGAFDISADLVIGADGRHSTMRDALGAKVAALGVPIDVLWFRIDRHDADTRESLAYTEAGGALVMLDRHDYWQCGFIIEKGAFDAIKAAGLDAFRSSIATLAKLPQGALAGIESWDDVKLLSVAVDHVSPWAADGILLIGDAAHAMSPVGGVGINYAIADAIGAANILVPALRAKKGALPLATLNAVEARRAPAALRMQKLQVLLQDRFLAPILRAKKGVRMPLPFRFLAWFPILRRIPARVIGLGFRPEHIEIDF
ncbi:MAG TPA: FAD-dependent oxidoreductase [Candidatus Paceibacterota bacterium]|nr:FAD-dependent oxidoreductase [Candidatus Paceibacterota bacterium]